MCFMGRERSGLVYSNRAFPDTIFLALFHFPLTFAFAVVSIFLFVNLIQLDWQVGKLL